MRYPQDADALLRVACPAANGQTVMLRDYAGAGATGTEYASWLPARDAPPAPSEAKTPPDGSTIAPGKMLFQWTAPKPPLPNCSYAIVVSESEDFAHPVWKKEGLREARLVVEAAELPAWKLNHWYYWKVIVTANPGGVSTTTESVLPPARFRVDTSLPPLPESFFAPKPRRDLLIQDALRGKSAPGIGSVQTVERYASAPGPKDEPNGAVDLNGVSDILRYNIGAFPEEDYSARLAVRVAKLPTGLGQVCSAWAVSQDDPLRICVENGKLFARMEAGGNGFSTEGVPVQLNTWMRVAVVKEESTLTLYVDGVIRGVCHVPVTVHSTAKDIALGGNPHFGGKEFLAIRVSDFRFYGRALSPQEAQR